MEEKRLSSREAAKVLGVSVATISNLMRRGVLTAYRAGNWHYFNRDEVEALVPKTRALHDIDAQIWEAEKELQDEATRRIGEIRAQRARREYIEALAGTTENWVRYREVVMSLYKAVVHSGIAGEFLTARECSVIDDVLNFVPIHEIAERLGLTAVRVRQIFNKALRRVMHFSRNIAGNYEAMKDEASTLKQEIVALREAVNAKAKENIALKSELVKYTPQFSVEENVDDFIFKNLDYWDLSVRALNCLRNAGINSVMDLVKKERKELLDLRNFGKKSLNEIESFLAAHGLKLGMKNILEYGQEHE